MQAPHVATDFLPLGPLLDTKMHVISLKLIVEREHGRNFNRLSYDNYARRAATPRPTPDKSSSLFLSFSLSLSLGELAPSKAPQRFPGIHLLRINQCVKLITAGRSS